jgi:hypothetical protein
MASAESTEMLAISIVRFRDVFLGQAQAAGFLIA